MTDTRIAVARVYDPPAARSGRRVLVDRMWPRGISKADAGLDEWCRDIAPTAALRRWYAHRPERFAEFRRRYLAELDDADHAEAWAHLTALGRHGRLILLTAVRDVTLSHAAVLADKLVEERGSSSDKDGSKRTNPRAEGQ